MTSARPTPNQIAARVAPLTAASAAPRNTSAGRRLSGKAAAQIQELAVDQAINEPHSTERTHQHNGTLYVRGDLGIIVPDDDPAVVVALLRIDPDAAPAPRARRSTVGPAHRAPESSTELERMLRGHGFEISAGRGGHHKATHREHPGVTIIIPHTPSDHRSYPNLLAEIRRRTGLDIR
ncbi:type II toxin-antitoxin system HicA family toxin [Microbacterium oleivorans]|uniref:Type II toxin-antitoxin system HicA family toxin n=1 Tax=Microbacterium oleivorans TaxID=273677 RepID=A0A7D5EWA8_9MICO|nr:type II toxin-antitoxin system HicA family toxin [Microbacterium oleivorans]QLD10448.1 type II toxin-antitoxin system HicA family toxin [Microbacterium oleivorans]